MGRVVIPYLAAPYGQHDRLGRYAKAVFVNRSRLALFTQQPTLRPLVPTRLCTDPFARHCEARSAVAIQGSHGQRVGSGDSKIATPQARLAMTDGSGHASAGIMPKREGQTAPPSTVIARRHGPASWTFVTDLHHCGARSAVALQDGEGGDAHSRTAAPPGGPKHAAPANTNRAMPGGAHP